MVPNTLFIYNILPVSPFSDLSSTLGSCQDHDIEMHRAKNIMRLVLRIAVAEKHRSLVLGTMSYCQETLGVSRQKQSESQAKNPAIWWREVLTEPEFSGQGLWREICFGVSDRWNDASYYEAFKKNLQGLGV